MASTLRKFELVRIEQERLFETVWNVADGLFDSMLQGAGRSGTLSSEIMLSALLTPIKTAFSNVIAQALSGVQVHSAGSGSAGGLFSRIFGD